MEENQATPFVFISYSHTDREFVTRLRADLQSQGITTWFDQEGLQPGTPDWEEALRNAAHAAHAVLLIASPNARSSRYVKDELRIAEMYRRPVYPVWAAGAQWMDSIPLGWGGTQYIDAREAHYVAAVREIVTALRKLLGEAPQTPSLIPEPGFEPRNPYKGLRAFTSEDSRDFFGRDTLIHELALALQESLNAEKKSNQSARLLTVIGPSGSGKSSVVMAGLLPCLQAGKLPELPGGKEWMYLDPMVPGVHPIESLTVALSRKLGDKSLKAIREDLEDESARGLHLLATSLARRQETKVVLFVDQFEELFTQTTVEEERRRFIDLLMTAITEPHGPVIAILTLRADFYDRPMHYPELSQLIEAHCKPVLPMNLKDLRAAIEEPATLPDVQLSFEGDLVGDLMFEVQGQAGALPLLQFTLDQLFQLRNEHQLTLLAYQKIGGVKGALAQHAESTYASLSSDEHRTLARVLFLRLIDPGTTEQDTTRRRAALTELSLPDPNKTTMLRETADTFIAARLLTTNEVAGTTTIEVSHEALIREWTRLADWLRTSRSDILLQKTIREDANEWMRHSKPAYLLYEETQLDEAKAWAERNMPNIDEAAFLQASAAERERQVAEKHAQQARELNLQRRVTSQQRRVIILMGVTSVVLLVGLLVALVLSGQLQVKNHDLQVANQNLQRSLPVSVTNLNDDGQGSLREAIRNASQNSTITFANSLKGTIKLTKELEITKNLTIIGPGASILSISGENISRVFFNTKGAIVEISNLTIKNGYVQSCQVSDIQASDGGGILNDFNTTLLLTNSTITRNLACYGSGIFNYGLLILTNSIITGNTATSGGGGIFNDNNLNLLNSTVSDNTTDYDGGGILNYSTFTSIDSTISGNTAHTDGGGIENYGSSSVLTLTNSTISNNTADGNGGGIDNSKESGTSNGGISYIRYCTIYNNAAKTGGDVANESKGVVNVEASIVGGDQAGSIPDISGTLTLLYEPSLVQNASTKIVYSDEPVKHSLIGISPKVRPLGNYGGVTQTRALFPDSPAIDKISANDEECKSTYYTLTDQRGVTRPQGTGCDIGAYEYP